MSADQPRVLVVIPAFNEEAAVGDVVREVRRQLPSAGCLVVDDGSLDATAEAAASAGALVARLPFNMGVGGAMRMGFRYALDNDYGIVVQVDADGQHDPAAAALLIAELATADLVIGARFAGTGEYRAVGPRRWAMRLLAATTSRIARTRLTDATSGFRATGPRGIRLFADHYPAEYLGDTVESLVIAARAGLTIRQLPVAMRPRQGGTPSQNPAMAGVYLLRAGLALVLAMTRRPIAIGAVVR